MKNLVYLIGVTICTTLLLISCSKQSGELRPDSSEANLKAQQQYVICHLDEDGNWNVITVNENALPAHLGHGDEFYWNFPDVATYQWSVTIDDNEHHLTLNITEVGNNYFSGYGVDHYYSPDDKAFTIADGDINNDGSVSFTVDYDDDTITDFNVVGSFECGVGITGSILDEDGNIIGSWIAEWNGGFSDDNGLVEITPP